MEETDDLVSVRTAFYLGDYPRVSEEAQQLVGYVTATSDRAFRRLVLLTFFVPCVGYHRLLNCRKNALSIELLLLR